MYDELMKGVLLGIFTLALFFVSSGSVLATVKASDLAKPKQELILLQEINRLLLEVQELQLLLKQRLLLLPEQPYQSVFFDRPYEAIYFINGITLKSATRSNLIRPIDYELFELLKSIVGEAVVRERVREWRVFYDEEEDLGGFVELIPGTDDWVFGVNRAQYETNDLNSKKAFADLIIHEYAHMLLFDQPEFTQNYTEQFWTTADKRHQILVSQAETDKRFSVLIEYFDANPDRFVSDYATLSPEEDLAESFVTFVREDRSVSKSLRNEKINALYNLPELVSVRIELRSNLARLGLLN